MFLSRLWFLLVLLFGGPGIGVETVSESVVVSQSESKSLLESVGDSVSESSSESESGLESIPVSESVSKSAVGLNRCYLVSEMVGGGWSRLFGGFCC